MNHKTDRKFKNKIGTGFITALAGSNKTNKFGQNIGRFMCAGPYS